MRSTSIFYDGTQALRVCHSAANKQLIIACDLLLFIAFLLVTSAFTTVSYFDGSKWDKCIIYIFFTIERAHLQATINSFNLTCPL